ncbi:MAG: hypothetical protein HY293_19020 [Planctomycetes bacterium]|nr:hypothetical protein [Planctomycetota bacterium]
MMQALLLILLAAAQDAPYSAAEMTALHQNVDDLVRRGRFLPAAEKLRQTVRTRIPPGETAKFAESERRVANYAALVLETAAGTTMDVPALTRIAIKNGGKPLGRIVKDDSLFLLYETLTGIRSRLSKELVDTLTPLTPEECAKEVFTEFRRQCGNRMLLLQTEAGKPPAWKELGGKKVTGAQYFALAEFAARNGAGEFLPGLFDLALARDPDLRATAHAAKGERLVNQLFFALTVNQLPQANFSLDALTTRYRDTAPYKDKLYADKETAEIVKVLLKRDLPEPKAAPLPEPPKPATPDAPAPAAPLAPALPIPEPLPLPLPEPAPAPPGVPVTAIKLPGGTLPEVVDLVAKGDKYFDEGMKHLLNSDQGSNPDGWSQENKAALELFRKANAEAYLLAQDKYTKGWPQPLLDRVRETTMRVALCRKRSVRQD